MKNLMLTTALALALGAAPAFAANMIAPDGLKASESTVTVGSVTADRAGYLVVHEADETGTIPGTIIGHAAVKAGESKGVKITLEKKPKAGSKLIVMLHSEDDNDTDFDDADKAVTEGRGPVMQVVAVE